MHPRGLLSLQSLDYSVPGVSWNLHACSPTLIAIYLNEMASTDCPSVLFCHLLLFHLGAASMPKHQYRRRSSRAWRRLTGQFFLTSLENSSSLCAVVWIGVAWCPVHGTFHTWRNLLVKVGVQVILWMYRECWSPGHLQRPCWPSGYQHFPHCSLSHSPWTRK